MLETDDRMWNKHVKKLHAWVIVWYSFLPAFFNPMVRFTHINLHLVLLNPPQIFGQIFDQIFGKVFDQISGQGFDQGLGEGKNHKYSVQYYRS